MAGLESGATAARRGFVSAPPVYRDSRTISTVQVGFTMRGFAARIRAGKVESRPFSWEYGGSPLL
jgi:hypothetical protein